MDRVRKIDLVSDLSEKFTKAKAAFLVDFKGMNVEQVTDLRKKLYPLDSEFKVIRNTLAKRSLESHTQSQNILSQHLIGTNAIVFSYGDVVATAKILVDFAKDVESLETKTGIMDGSELNKKQIEFLSSLPTKEVLQAKFLGVLTAPLSKFVRVLNEVPASFVRALDAYKSKQ